MSTTKISWADVVWNPIAGCSPVSEGCRNCYAAREAVRLAGNPNAQVAAKYAGTARMTGEGPNRRAVFTGRINFDEAALSLPLRWRKPRRVFVNSMSDLFHDGVPDAYLNRVFAVMALAPQHTFLVLTKRPERGAAYLNETPDRTFGLVYAMAGFVGRGAPWQGKGLTAHLRDREFFLPLPNVWLGTSCEDQAAAAERIPHLLRTPAAVRFLSCEPLLGPIDLLRIANWKAPGATVDVLRFGTWDEPGGFVNHCDMHGEYGPLHQVIIGGESGPKARPCDVAWIRSLVEQCRDAGVAAYVKQLGARPTTAEHLWKNWPGGVKFAADHETIDLRDPKGGDMAEWPEDLRVREMPEAARV